MRTTIPVSPLPLTRRGACTDRGDARQTLEPGLDAIEEHYFEVVSASYVGLPIKFQRPHRDAHHSGADSVEHAIHFAEL